MMGLEVIHIVYRVSMYLSTSWTLHWIWMAPFLFWWPSLLSTPSVCFGIIPRNICGCHNWCKHTQEESLNEWVWCLGLLLSHWPSASVLLQAVCFIERNSFMPLFFAIGYHKCCCNYRNQRDVSKVNAGLDQHKIPSDIWWTEIEKSDGKRYSHGIQYIFQLQLRYKRTRRLSDARLSHSWIPVSRSTPLTTCIPKRKGRDITSGMRMGTIFHGWCWSGDSSCFGSTSHQVRY